MRSGRAIANGRDEGVTKLLFDDSPDAHGHGKILGSIERLRKAGNELVYRCAKQRSEPNSPLRAAVTALIQPAASQPARVVRLHNPARAWAWACIWGGGTGQRTANPDRARRDASPQASGAIPVGNVDCQNLRSFSTAVPHVRWVHAPNCVHPHTAPKFSTY